MLTSELELYLEVPLSMEQPLHPIHPHDLLLFVKLYDPVHQHLTCLGSRYARRTQKLPELLPILNKMAGFPEGTALEVKLRLGSCRWTAEQLLCIWQVGVLHRSSKVQAYCTCTDNINDACQPGLGACGASLSSPGRLVLSNLIGKLDRVSVRQDHIVPNVLLLHKSVGPLFTRVYKGLDTETLTDTKIID